MKEFVLILAATLLLISCSSKKDQKAEVRQARSEVQKNRPVSVELGKFFKADGREMLYGGEADSQHFDVSNLTLEKDQFHYGIGREKFPALLEPEFTTVEEASSVWSDSDRFLVAHAGGEAKAYSVKDLTRHEVVNDELDGKPIMAAYCHLADLGAIYERQYGDQVLTFALSGYTYYDPEVWDGLDGFVFWDRETESLWWPLIGKAVSGSLEGVKLMEMDSTQWEDTDWATVKKSYPDAKVLKTGQDFTPPENWDKIEDVSGIVENFSAEEE